MSGEDITAEVVLDAIGRQYAAALVECTDQRDRWLATGNHVRATLRENERLKSRNAHLEARLAAVQRAADGKALEP